MYTELIKQIAPAGAGVDRSALDREDLLERAEIMLEQADKIQSRAFVTAKVSYKINKSWMTDNIGR